MGNIINDLKKIIFASKIGVCPSASEWQRFYKEGNNQLPTKHLASCSDCLDIVNRLHSIPTLSERNPFDTIERDSGDSNSTPFSSSSSNSSSSGEKGSNSSAILRKLEENRQKQFEYLPKEITFCVNGWPFTSRQVEVGANRLTIRPKLDDLLESLEILDERGVLLFHILLSENDQNSSLQKSLDISPNQHISFSIIWLEDYPEINLEYRDKRLTQKEVGEVKGVKNSFSSFFIELKSFFSIPKFVFAATMLGLFVISLITIEVFWQRKFDTLEQQLTKISSEKESFKERLTKAEAINQTLEKDLVSVQEQIKQKEILSPQTLPTPEPPKVELLSKIKLALAIAAQNTITNLIYNTRSVISPILLQRSSQSIFGVRLPKYEENSQQEFNFYIVKLNLPKEKPFVQKVKIPASSANPAFVSVEIKIYNTNNIPANTAAEAVIIGVVGSQEVKIDTIPLKFE